MFTNSEYFPGIYHITDNMGVNMTLLKGSKKVLLVDTGYGLEDVKAYSEALAEMPVQVLLTHGHHDHALGTACFSSASIFPEDLPVFRFYTRTEQRRRVAYQAETKGVSVPADYETRTIHEPSPLFCRPDRETGFDLAETDLGGLTVRIYRVPGHTEGSAVVYVPEYRLLLSGDNWNLCTWCWFPESKDIREFRNNMKKLFTVLPFEHVLCSHRSELWEREKAVQFFNSITEENLRTAPAFCPENPENIRRLVIPGGMELVFDADKQKQDDS